MKNGMEKDILKVLWEPIYHYVPRCYSDAMPIDECYRIIEDGRGVDFDPDVVDAFMMDKSKVEKIRKANYI